MNGKEPILRFQKNAEPKTHKMIIPKVFIEKWGNSFYMEVYEKICEISGICESYI